VRASEAEGHFEAVWLSETSAKQASGGTGEAVSVRSERESNRAKCIAPSAARNSARRLVWEDSIALAFIHGE
jgi:hypothetical protein